MFDQKHENIICFVLCTIIFNVYHQQLFGKLLLGERGEKISKT